MPWTFAHPAAVLPMRRLCPRYLHFSALVIGSLIPDVGFHFGLFALATYAHTFAGSVVVCVPLGMALLICFSAVRRPLWHLLPQPHRDALEPLIAQPLPQGIGNSLRSSASILLGAWSHIAWDSFTHSSGWSVAHIAALRSAIPIPGIGDVALYNVLQHLSTVVGVLIVVLAYRSWLASRGTSLLAIAGEDRWRYAILAALAVGSAVLALLLAILGTLPLDGRFPAQDFAFRLAVYGAVLFTGSTLIAGMYAFRSRYAAPRSTQ